MTYLYVANVTRQNMAVYYRTDFMDDGSAGRRLRAPPARHQNIPPGKQIPLGGDMPFETVKDIVEQLNRYNMVGEVDVSKLRDRRGFVPLVFNIDKPVSEKALRAVVAHNSGVKVDEGKDRRKKAAIAASSALVEQVAEQPPLFEVEIEQLDVSEADEKRIEEGFRVSPSAPGPKSPSSRVRTKKAA